MFGNGKDDDMWGYAVLLLHGISIVIQYLQWNILKNEVETKK
jgi:hypothetical protein